MGRINRTHQSLAVTSLHANKAVRKYLDQYAEDSAHIGARLAQSFNQVVVIPAYGEDQILDRAIDSIPGDSGDPSLAIVVINERDASPATVKSINAATSARLRTRFGDCCQICGKTDGKVDDQLDEPALLCRTPFGALLLLRVTLPDDQGVGLARKHGADLALGAWAAGLIASPWIHCTDADVQLPDDYFRTPESAAAVALHRFRHVATHDDAQEAARTYDLWLRLHVLGLHWAASPYGFHSIGSTITVNAVSYARVRGFPRRNAAEDFYFLNKLAKTGTVIAANSAPLRIAARVSDRVPFGTGRAIGLARSEGLHALPRFYHPRVYVYLKAVLAELERSCDSGFFERSVVRRALSEQQLDPAPLEVALNTLGLDAAVERTMRSSPQRHTRLHAVHCWFDAFRTLKLIHHLRDNGVASVDAKTALAKGQFLLDQSSQRVQDDIAVIRDEAASPAPQSATRRIS
ncbi:MAG: glycosyltransferase involved in cell wall biosynthesis [Gammaproteobacteria bacterium]|jgi:glycosyltransferase involved in cell wall biosynthesis